MWKKNPRLGIYFNSKTEDISVPKGELCYANNPDSLFRKYKHLVTAFANQGAGADFLGLPHTDYHLLLPNGFQLRDGNNYYLEVTTRPVIAYKLYPALVGLDNCLEYINGADDALQFLFSVLGISKKIHPLEFAYMADSSTFNPNANPEVSSVDGWIQKTAYGSQGSTTWNAARNASSSGSAYDADTTNSTDASWVYTYPGYYITRSFFLFDSSSLGNNIGITAASITLHADTASGIIGCVQSSPASNTGLIGDDFDQCGTLNSPTEGSARVTMNGNNNQNYLFSLNSSGRSWISKTGISKFGFRKSFDLDNVAPTIDSSGTPRFYSAESGTTYDPALVVDYTTTSTSTTTTSTSTSTTTSSSSSTSTTTTSTSTTTTLTTTTSTSTTTTSTSTSTTTTSTSTTTTSTSTSTTTVTVPREFVIDNPAV